MLWLCETQCSKARGIDVDGGAPLRGFARR